MFSRIRLLIDGQWADDPDKPIVKGIAGDICLCTDQLARELCDAQFAEFVNETPKEEVFPTKPPEIIDINKLALEDLNLSLHVTNHLYEVGIDCAAYLCELKPSDILQINGLGKKRLIEIEQALAEMGAKLQKE